jgi:predicted Zn-dependent protease
LGGAGFLVYKTFFQQGGAAAVLQAAEQSYQAGNLNYASNPQESAIRYDEANLSTDKALKLLEQDEKKGMPKEELERLRGQMYWLKARALRDRAYAKAKAEGKEKELIESLDTTTNEKYRNYFHIPDRKEQVEALSALRAAADLLPNEPELNKEITRVEISINPVNWKSAEPILRNTIRLNSDIDKQKPRELSRAHYFLAKYYFEQPTESLGWYPTPPDKREHGKITEAKTHLEAAKKYGAPYWRTAHLEADILGWELMDAKKGKNKSNIESTTKALETALFAKEGILDRASKKEQYTALSELDVRGIFGVHNIAMWYATQGVTGSAADKAGKAEQVIQSLLTASNYLGESPLAEPYLPDAGETVAQQLLYAQQVLANTKPKVWRQTVEEVQAFFKKYPKAEVRPATTMRMAQVAEIDGRLDRGSQPARQKEAIKALESGLAKAKQANVPPEQLADFHAALAQTKLLNNLPAAEVQGHVAELRKLNLPRLKAVTDFLEGVLAERQGKLEKARTLLEGVQKDKEAKNTPFALKSVSQLAYITYALGDFKESAGYFDQVAEALKQTSDIPPDSILWLEQTANTREDAIAMQVKASLQAGIKRINQNNRGKTNPTITQEQVAPILEAALRSAKELRKPSSQDHAVRLAIVAFRYAVKDNKTAEEELAKISTDYPESDHALRLSVNHLMQPAPDKKEVDPSVIAKADEKIQQFLRLNPSSQSAKLFWAQHLIQTKRASEAAKYLRDPVHFPEPDPVVNRVLANALFQIGENDEARKVLGNLSSDPLIDYILLGAEARKQEKVQELMDKYENNGVIRLYDAAAKMNEGKFEEAAKGFESAVEFTNVKPAALAGVQRALVSFAGSDPTKAVGVIKEYIDARPDDAALYQAAALAHLYLDEVGEPNDTWGTKRTMYAAVNKWEQVLLKGKTEGPPDPSIGLTKAQFHMFAGNPLLARQEAIRVNGQHPNHLPTLLYLTELFITGPDHDLTQAEKFLERAQSEAKADNPTPELLKGALLEAKEDYAGAIKHYESLMTRFPEITQPYARRVLIAQFQKKTGEALLWTNKWTEKFPNDPSATLTLIQVLAEGGELDNAVKKADEYASKQMELVTKALKEAKPAPKPEEETQALMIQRARLQLQLSGVFFNAKQYPEAKKRVEAVLKEIPDSPAALLIAGDIAVMEKDWSRAEQVYRKRIETDKNERKDFRATNNLAWILATQKNDPTAALTLVTQARKSRGEKPIETKRLPADFVDTIGTVYSKLGGKDHFEAMRQDFEVAVKRYNMDPRMHVFLGQAYAGLGENSKATISLDTAIRLASDAKNKAIREEQKADALKLAQDVRAKISGK